MDRVEADAKHRGKIDWLRLEDMNSKFFTKKLSRGQWETLS